MDRLLIKKGEIFVEERLLDHKVGCKAISPRGDLISIFRIASFNKKKESREKRIEVLIRIRMHHALADIVYFSSDRQAKII